MNENAPVFAGLNKKGTITFVVLLFLCLPLAWLPWVIGSMKADPATA